MWDNTIDIGHCSRLGFWESSVEFRVLEDRIGIKNDCKIIRVIEYDVDIYKYD